MTLAILLAALIASPQTPPIFQPGAPGAASSVITAGESVALSRSGFTPADVRFMQHMIVHHAQAVEMVALMPERVSSDRVRRLGERIAASQEAEIELMRDWLLSREQPLTAPDLHTGHHGHAGHDAMAVMPGMLSQAQMQALAAATGPAFDRLFLEGMIQHHRGALDMVTELNAESTSAEDPLLSDFAASVVADQSAEILRMQSILSASDPISEERP